VIEPQSAPAGPIEAEIRALVYDWYRKLDVHAPVEEILPALAEDATMVFPESTLRGLDAFKTWYQGGSAASALPGVINLFFDEKHELKRVDIAITGSGAAWRAEVGVVVRWEARRWKAPDAKSDYLGFDAWQRWAVVPSPKTGKPIIETYVVDALEPLQGSTPL
jgi:hypothetical protein